MNTVIWLEDNPDSIENEIEDIKNIFSNKLNIQVWDGSYEHGLRGKTCVEDFKNKVEEATKQESDNIVGFILDVRIPIDNLGVLGFSDIKTDGGLVTGVQIARYYLRNDDNKSPLGSSFIETPILFFTVAGGIANEFPWTQDENQKCSFVEKTNEENFNKVKKWLSQL